MTGNVLVPLDGSHAAETAIPFAAWLGNATGAGITLLTVLDRGETGEAPAGAAQEQLEATATRLRAASRTVTAQVEQGKPAQLLAERAGADDIDYVVLTTFGRDGDARHLGGTADRLARTLTKPSLFVSPASGTEPPITGPLLLALDGSSTAEAALATAQILAEKLNLALKLVRVAPWASTLFAAFTGLAPPSADAEIELGSNTYLAALVEQLPKTIDSDYQTLRGDPAEMLLEYTADQQGILILSSHGESAGKLSHLGSTTGKVLRASPTPVLLIPVPHTS